MLLCWLPTPIFLPRKLHRMCRLHIFSTGFHPHVTLPLISRVVVILTAPLTGVSWWQQSWKEKPPEVSEAAWLPGSFCGRLHPRIPEVAVERLWRAEAHANSGHCAEYELSMRFRGITGHYFDLWMEMSSHLCVCLAQNGGLARGIVLEVLSSHSSFLGF